MPASHHHCVHAGEAGGCRASYAGMGFLVRPPLPAEAARLYTADRNRRKELDATEQSGHAGLSHTNWPLQVPRRPVTAETIVSF